MVEKYYRSEKMLEIEKKLQQEVLKSCKAAEKECGCKMTRLMDTIERFGVVNAAKEIIRKGRTSDCFSKLVEAGHIELSLEAIIVKPQYEELFDDDEVNACFELLCENGYY